MTDLDLDDAREALADNGIDGPDLPHNPRALRAMRVAAQLLTEVERLLAQRDQAIATVARVRGLLDYAIEVATPSRYLVPLRPSEPFLAVWADDLCKALDGGAT